MFDLDGYLTARAALIDAALDREMPDAAERPARLHAAMRYSLFTGGKRLRPILCLAAAEAAGAAPERALMPALAVEVFHTYTLIHDDLPCLDNDDLRRGRPAAHKVYGEALALLAGDALQALAFEFAARAPVPAPWPPGAIVAELAQAAGSRGVVGGQVEDIAATGACIPRETLDYILLHKTADLFRAALRMGALAAGAAPATLDALTRYAVDLGIAFQLTDDLLDAGADGRAPADGETSCLMVMTAAEARAEAERLTADAHAALRSLPAGPAQPLAAVAGLVLRRNR